MKKYQSLATLSLILAIAFLTNTSKASQEVCDTLDECIRLKNLVEERIQTLSPSPVIRRTISGHVFKQVLDMPWFSDVAWEDESGLIWSDHDNAVSQKGVNQAEASRRCASKGGSLPTKKQFENLFNYFGGNTEEGYVMQIFTKWRARQIWTATQERTDYHAYLYDISLGRFLSYYKSSTGLYDGIENQFFSQQCVTRRN